MSATREWHFEAKPTKLASELLTAYMIGRTEHFDAGVTTLQRNDPQGLFEIVYSWAMGLAVISADGHEELCSAEIVRFAGFEEPAHSTSQQRGTAILFSALVSAAANRQGEMAQLTWKDTSQLEQTYIIRNILDNYQEMLKRRLNGEKK